MNDKIRNIYLRMIRLACDNIKSEICNVNSNITAKDIKIRLCNKTQLVECVEQIVKSPQKASSLYGQEIAQLLVVSTRMKLSHPLNVSEIFIDSIIMSRNARVSQKQLIDFTTAEMYLSKAYYYDRKYPNKNVPNYALEKAKGVIARMYSVTFLSDFVFDGSKPHIDENLRNELKAQAFDVRYSFVDEAKNNEIINRRYETGLGHRRDFFLTNSSKRNKELNVDIVRHNTTLRTDDVVNQNVESSDALVIADLYKKTFAILPSQKCRRKFVNLKLRNKDIILCPRRNLPVKRQFDSIEVLTKRHYIYDFFDDQMPKQITDVEAYYFQQETNMYNRIWGTSGEIVIKNDRLYFPNEIDMPIFKNMKPYEFLHKVNIVYAALFGVSSEDMQGGNNWLYDSIRKAYTDEGTADYRLTLIDTRMKSKR